MRHPFGSMNLNLTVCNLKSNAAVMKNCRCISWNSRVMTILWTNVRCLTVMPCNFTKKWSLATFLQ